MPGLRTCGLTLGLGLALTAGAARGSESAPRVEPDLAALARLALVTLPPMPAYAKGPESVVRSVDELTAEFGKVTDRPPQINFNRTSFVCPDARWLAAFNEWFVKLQKSLKLNYTDEVFDCDDFARTFVAFANLVALGGGETRGSICVGLATVAQKRAFGGVSASGVGGHAVVVAATANGVVVIEPQSGKMAPLREYPNRDWFEEVNL